MIERLGAFGSATAKAAASRDHAAALQALALNPLVGSLDLAERIGLALLRANEAPR
jgi:alpha-galactosidase/6-phospho-beta-glucosidase family protein